MNNETFIPMEDVLIRIKYHPDITKQEKEQFKEAIKGIYMTDKGKVKIELGIAKHKNAASKKQSIMERDIKRETSRELKNIDRY